MVYHLPGNKTVRKLRLFYCGCSRWLWFLLEERSREAVRTIEQYADGLAKKEELQAARQAARAVVNAASTSDRMKYDAANLPFSAAEVGSKRGLHNCFPGWPVSESDQVAMLRDIFGNPFRPVTVDPGWRTSNVLGLAQTIYDDRAFDRMPILADALEDAGCTNGELLNHCRLPGVHVRGCWVVDLVLGKG
ncbi:hypothetical protein AYO44_12160 [Planctomycetaceae bacterium SCGC AG-212-F19]|nr:hypothetical protein AYO44_12160 [Planctomycetaceae bacterium SCGC AG-212-F19]